jgi:putative oxidoreductase
MSLDENRSFEMTSNSTATSARDVMSLIGRVMVAYLFIPSGWSKLVGFAGTVGYISSKGIPLPEVAAAIAVAAELGLGILLLLGWKTRWVALALAAFTIAITPIFHNYWALPEAQQMMQKLNFTKNLAIAGGLLAFVAFGAGRLSLDGGSRRRDDESAGRAAYGTR